MKNLILISTLFLSILQGEVVITVHGFLRGEANFKKLGRYFEKRGDHVHHFIYSSRKKWIDDHAMDLCAFVESVEDNHPGEKICFVTHSMGGLVLRRAYQKRMPSTCYRSSIVLIAPPNQGSILARRMSRIPVIKGVFGRFAGKELHAYSDFHFLGPLPQEVKVMIIAGISGWNPLIPEKNDGKVAASETWLKEKPFWYKEVKKTHSTICSSKKVIKQAFAFCHEPEGPVSDGQSVSSSSIQTKQKEDKRRRKEETLSKESLRMPSN